MHTGFKYRIYPNSEQKILISKHFGCARFAYNTGLALKIKAWESEKKILSQFDLCKIFPKLKKEDSTKWLSEVCSHSLQCEMANLDAAYTRFFREKKGFPKFKSKKTDKKSYSTNTRIVVGGNFIKLPKLGKISAVISRPLVGRIVKATLSQSASGKYFVSILCQDDKDFPEKIPFTQSSCIGIDLGIKDFCVLSTGERVKNPRHFKSSLKKLRRNQRSQSRRVKGSKNHGKQTNLISRIHEKVSNQRRDFHHKLSTRIVRDNQVDAIALETLSVEDMKKDKRFSQAISDSGWSSFVAMMEYKSERSGKTILKIGRFEPSSKLCSCGVINHRLMLNDRKWKCDSCGLTHDRDVLAANNIKRMALHPKQSNTVGDTEI